MFLNVYSYNKYESTLILDNGSVYKQGVDFYLTQSVVGETMILREANEILQDLTPVIFKIKTQTQHY